MQATALVHEAYMRLVGDANQTWSGRAHFFGAAAEAMRRILVEKARRKKTEKRGGDRKQVSLQNFDVVARDDEELLALHEALDKFAREDPLGAKLVNLRYFAGLTMHQAAEVLGLPLRTAERNWTYSKTWLLAELSESP